MEDQEGQALAVQRECLPRFAWHLQSVCGTLPKSTRRPACNPFSVPNHAAEVDRLESYVERVCPNDLRRTNGRRYGSNDLCCHLVLQFENIVKRALEAVGPEVGAIQGVDELAGNTHFATGLADTTFEDVADTEVLTHHPYVHSLALSSSDRAILPVRPR